MASIGALSCEGVESLADLNLQNFPEFTSAGFCFKLCL